MDQNMREVTQEIYDELYRRYIRALDAGDEADRQQDYATRNRELQRQHVLRHLTNALRRTLNHNERPLIKAFVGNEFQLWVAAAEQHNDLPSTRDDEKVDPFLS